VGHTNIYSLPWPELADPADGPDGYQDLAVATELALLRERDTPDDVGYTPTWRAAGNIQPGGMLWTARYNVRNGVCSFHIFGEMPPQIGGGTGQLYVGLPVRARADIFEQYALTKLYLGGNVNRTFAGFSNIPAGQIETIPAFPYSPDSSVIVGWSSCDNSAVPGTGIPHFPDQHAVQPGNLDIWGRYFV
jgi:hypothetical protein